MSLLYWLPMVTDSLENQGLSTATATNYSTTVVDGKLGKCRSFNGSSYIDTGFTNPFSTGDFSLACWFNITQTSGTTYQALINCKGIGAANVGCSIYWNQNQKKFLWSTGDGSSAVEIWTSSTFENSVIYGKWHHIVMVREANDPKHGYFFIDGVRYDLASVPNILDISSSNTFYIGRILKTGAYYHTGSICDVRIYDHVLSPREAKELAKGLVAHYPLSRGGFGCDNLLDKTYIPEDGVGYYVPYGNGTVTVDNEFTYNGIPTLRITPSSSTTNSGACSVFNNAVTLTQDVTYTYSCMIYSTVEDTFTTNSLGHFQTLKNAAHNMTKIYEGDVIPANTWTHVKIVFTPTADEVIFKSFFIYFANTSQVIHVCNIKLEKGSVPTAWTPNATDDLYTSLGLNNNIAYDVSGFKNNAVLYSNDGTGSFIYEASSPRYGIATRIHSLNPTTNAGSGTVYIRANCGLTTPKQITIAFWAYCRKGYFNSTGNGLFCTTSVSNDPGGGDYTTSAMNNYDGMVRFNDESGNGFSVSVSGVENEWHHYAITYDGRTGTFYLDGVNTRSNSFNTESALASFTSVLIGFSKAGNAWRRNDNAYSDFRIYATCLDQASITALYNTPISLSSNGTLLSNELQET